MSPTESQPTYGYSHGGSTPHNPTLTNTLTSAPFPTSTNSANSVQQTHSNNHGGTSNSNSTTTLGPSSNSNNSSNAHQPNSNVRSHYAKKISKTLEEESVVWHSKSSFLRQRMNDSSPSSSKSSKYLPWYLSPILRRIEWFCMVCLCLLYPSFYCARKSFHFTNQIHSCQLWHSLLDSVF